MNNFCGSNHLILITRLCVLLLVAHVTVAGRVIVQPEKWTTSLSIATNDNENDDVSSTFSREELVQIAGYGEDKLSTVLITGTVVCKHKVDHLPKPVSGAIVAATCRSPLVASTRNKEEPTPPARWVKAVTDNYGEFTIDLPSHLHAIPDIENSCSIKIHSIPKNNNNYYHSCHQSTITDLSKGLQLSFSGNGIRTYTAGTIEFIPIKLRTEKHKHHNLSTQRYI